MPGTLLAPPKISLQDILDTSVSGQPEINLEWEPFQTQVDAFLRAIDTYAVSAKTEIAARANDHVNVVRELNARTEEAERQIHREQQNEHEMLATIEVERKTVSDFTQALTGLQTKLAKVREQNASLEHELTAIRKEVRGDTATKERQGRALEEQRRKDEMELAALEGALGLSITGVAANRLLVLFTLIDPSDAKREFSFVLDCNAQDYVVPQCDPPVADMPDLVQRLNGDRDLHSFIKRVRKAFVALVAPPPGKFDDLNGPSTSRTTTPPAAPTATPAARAPSVPPVAEANLIDI
ncbi:putative kinetochore protein SPC25 [Vanrija pseudolonga]|uniref:Kinetochore protein SPC25 n=1 Tax=Vanrija pseudolonga TaxID=143232 RepID=A0AAF0YDA9_9TREE|nr:putative kinetochore protein SPC25 [Vanrija pseudolonga]